MQWHKLLGAMMATGLLASCGGSSVSLDGNTDGGSGSPTPPADPTFSLIARLCDKASFNESTLDLNTCKDTVDITYNQPAILYVQTLKDADGDGKKSSPEPVEYQLVTIETSVAKAAQDTILTNANGVAIVELTAQQEEKAGAVTATWSDITESKNYRVSSVAVEANATYSIEIDLPTIDEANESLAPGSSLQAKATVYKTLNGNKEVYSDPVSVSFTSGCSAQAKADLDASAVTQEGIAVATYKLRGCVGDDKITANVTIGDKTYSATSNIFTNDSAPLSNIEFVSATPESISLKSASAVGLAKASTVKFRLLDTNGLPVPGKSMSFSLDSTIGDARISSPIDATGKVVGTTNASGEIEVQVEAGNIPYTIRVIATVEGSNPVITAVSDRLVISTGIADQNSFSLSATDMAPWSWGFDGAKSTLTIRAADRFNNTVPDGTAIYFNAEGGRIASSCQTVNGECSVDWISQNPRPAEPETPHTNWGNWNNSNKGRVTITAVAVGEESFLDQNSNGLFDTGEMKVADNLPEAWFDYNEDGVFNQGTEEYRDYDLDGSYSNANCNSGNSSCATPKGTGETPIYNGTLCPDNLKGTSCVSQLLEIRQTLVIAMAGDIGMSKADFRDGPVQIYSGGAWVNNTANTNPVTTLSLATGDTGSVYFMAKDINGNSLPSGTTITVSCDNQCKVYGNLTTTISGDTPNAKMLSFGATRGKATEDGTLEVKVSNAAAGINVGYSFPLLLTKPTPTPTPTPTN